MLARDVEDYLISCRARRLSLKTIKEIYGPNLKLFLTFADSQGIDQLGQIDQRLMDRYSTTLLDSKKRNGQPISPYTVHSYVRVVNAFLGWAKAEGEDIKAKGQLPRLPRPVVDVLTREEIDRLEDAAQCERDKLIIRLLANTGCRVGELIGLRLDDIRDTSRNYTIHVTGKGERSRSIPLSRPLYMRLKRYADRGRPKGVTSDHVFISLRVRPSGFYERITPSAVEQMLYQVADRAGMTKRVYPHMFRHSFITFALQRGMSAVQLARIVGHADLTMINTVYSHLNQEDANDAMLRLFSEG